MNDKVFLCIIYLIFLSLSYLLFRYIITLKKISALLIFIVYLIGIYYYFELINQLHYYLRDKGIYIELGHASLSLILLMFFCYLNAFILLIIIILKMIKSNKVISS